MSEDMPWVLGLTDEEVQELRKNKQELTQYGKEKIRKLMNNEPTQNVITAKVSKEDYQKVLDAAKQGIEEYKPALEELAKDD